MTHGPSPQDLVVLVADTDMERAVGAMFARSEALGIRPIQHKIYRHDLHDPGCRAQGHLFLRPFARAYKHALVIFDHEGCGSEQTPSDELERRIEETLAQNGWGGRAAAIAIEPELEVWFWGSSAHVPKCVGWNSIEDLRAWLETRNLWRAGDPKPLRPKEAVEQALEKARRAKSSSIYAELAEHSSLRHCRDTKFKRFTEILRQWFPREETDGCA